VQRAFKTLFFNSITSPTSKPETEYISSDSSLTHRQRIDDKEGDSDKAEGEVMRNSFEQFDNDFERPFVRSSNSTTILLPSDENTALFIFGPSTGSSEILEIDEGVNVRKTLGDKDGVHVGDTLGDKDGVHVGDTLGDKDGVHVGDTLGDKDGVHVGDTLGDKDGVHVGDTLGDKDGVHVGDTLGDKDGVHVGDTLGDKDGVHVGDPLGALVGTIDAVEMMI
jgi:hypothetical protein